MNTRLQTIVEE